jgi:acetoin utilization deacetylase AcuC-like enzyme
VPGLPTGIVYSDVYRAHDTGPDHPERPERLDAVMSALADLLASGRAIRVEPRPATREEILACHSTAWFDHARRFIEAGQESLGFPDTNVSSGSWEAALLAAGGVIAAVDAVFAGRVTNAFCAVRPPGHHATPGQGMGFCIFNNVAVAARHAQRHLGVERVLIADWDVHHGNGTQDIFWEDGSVLYFSIHQRPWYPGTGSVHETGSGPGEGLTLNCPLPAGAGRLEVFQAFEDRLVPAADRFKPDLVLISAGFDSRIHDMLGELRLKDQDFSDLTDLMMGIANRHARGRLVSVLEGGYSLGGLASATLAHVNALSRAAAVGA